MPTPRPSGKGSRSLRRDDPARRRQPAALLNREQSPGAAEGAVAPRVCHDENDFGGVTASSDRIG